MFVFSQADTAVLLLLLIKLLPAVEAIIVTLSSSERVGCADFFGAASYFESI